MYIIFIYSKVLHNIYRFSFFVILSLSALAYHQFQSLIIKNKYILYYQILAIVCPSDVFHQHVIIFMYQLYITSFMDSLIIRRKSWPNG